MSKVVKYELCIKLPRNIKNTWPLPVHLLSNMLRDMQADYILNNQHLAALASSENNIWKVGLGYGLQLFCFFTRCAIVLGK